MVSGNIRYTQPEMSKEFSGGVDPVDAYRHHEEYLPRAVDEALSFCKSVEEDLEAIAFTIGPGQI